MQRGMCPRGRESGRNGKRLFAKKRKRGGREEGRKRDIQEAPVVARRITVPRSSGQGHTKMRSRGDANIQIPLQVKVKRWWKVSMIAHTELEAERIDRVDQIPSTELKRRVSSVEKRFRAVKSTQRRMCAVNYILSWCCLAPVCHIPPRDHGEKRSTIRRACAPYALPETLHMSAKTTRPFQGSRSNKGTQIGTGKTGLEGASYSKTHFTGFIERPGSRWESDKADRPTVDITC
ncbi:hypothetical protein K438DRAFT_1759185 [Mycena galopus ATCC 62051]|nr:hypothetical protein K438DRAFT_1759185 [Mycena galopus ATCC 62051]